tara:strand:+ start:1335 stop:1778 length:444 start_codon:yes stop_codon:yes gene_type:complete
MSQGDYVKIDSKIDAEKKIPFLLNRVENWDYSTPLFIQFNHYEDPRTIEQLALFHIWCRELSEEFISKVPEATDEGIKWMMKSMFLGKDTIKVGNTILPDQVRQLPKNKGEMCYFMDQVYKWASEREIYLSLPQPNEYTALKRKQEE